MNMYNVSYCNDTIRGLMVASFKTRFVLDLYAIYTTKTHRQYLDVSTVYFLMYLHYLDVFLAFITPLGAANKKARSLRITST